MNINTTSDKQQNQRLGDTTEKGKGDTSANGGIEQLTYFFIQYIGKGISLVFTYFQHPPLNTNLTFENNILI